MRLLSDKCTWDYSCSSSSSPAAASLQQLHHNHHQQQQQAANIIMHDDRDYHARHRFLHILRLHIFAFSLFSSNIIMGIWVWCCPHQQQYIILTFSQFTRSSSLAFLITRMFCNNNSFICCVNALIVRTCGGMWYVWFRCNNNDQQRGCTDDMTYVQDGTAHICGWCLYRQFLYSMHTYKGLFDNLCMYSTVQQFGFDNVHLIYINANMCGVRVCTCACVVCLMCAAC